MSQADSAHITPFGAGTARLMPVYDKRFHPEINVGYYLMVVPTSAYTAAGFYIVEEIPGKPVLYRCQGNFRPKAPAVHMNDNRNLAGHEVPVDAFTDMVIGYVAGIINVLDRDALQSGVARVSPIEDFPMIGGAA